MKVLILGYNHSSVMNSMVTGLRQNGTECNALSFEFNRNKYANYDEIELVFKKGYNKPALLRGLFKLIKLARSSDVIHVISGFTTGSRFLQKTVERLIFSQKKKKFITFTGNDIRIPEIELAINKFYKYAYFNPGYEGRVLETAGNSKNLQHFFFNYGFNVISNAETYPYVDRNFFKKISVIHHPSQNKVEIISKKINPDKIKIIHAPTSYYFKGSGYVFEAIRQLENKGVVNFEFECIINVSNKVYMQKLSEADVLIDQLIAGWYGISAQQGLESGKVVVAYIEDKRLQTLQDCPIVNANINNLAIVLENLLMHTDQLKQIGNQGIIFYEKYHKPSEVGNNLMKCYCMK